MENYINEYAIVIQNYDVLGHMNYWVLHLDFQSKSQKPVLRYETDSDFGQIVAKNPQKYRGMVTMHDEMEELTVKF